jgi:hypothetical protein
VSTKNGISGPSVFETRCACPADDDCLCAHAAKHYSAVAPDPCALWTFELETAFQGFEPRLVPAPSKSGDTCHRTIENVKNSQLRKVLDAHANKNTASIRFCVSGHLEPFSYDRAAELKAMHEAPKASP